MNPSANFSSVNRFAATGTVTGFLSHLGSGNGLAGAVLCGLGPYTGRIVTAVLNGFRSNAITNGVRFNSN